MAATTSNTGAGQLDNAKLRETSITRRVEEQSVGREGGPAFMEAIDMAASLNQCTCARRRWPDLLGNVVPAAAAYTTRSVLSQNNKQNRLERDFCNPTCMKFGAMKAGTLKDVTV